MKLALVGSREFNDYDMFSKIVEKWMEENGRPECIISGGAKGADTLAEKLASEMNIELIVFKPNYDKNPKLAPLERNTLIAEACTHMLAFPTKNSKGTYDSINKASKMKKIVKIYNV